MSNYFFYKKDCEYSTDTFYRPSELYPEYPFKQGGIAEKKNDIYEMMRNLFRNMELDIENFNTASWNPFGKYIKKGQIVLIKPNLVSDWNGVEKDYNRGMACLITHPSVVRCIIDYVLIALGGTGKIIVGDAPVQNCDFNRLKRISGYQRLERFYRNYYASDFEIKDLRRIILRNDNGNLIQLENEQMGFREKIVNLSTKSYFYREKFSGKLRVTNYDARDVNIHHNGKRQEYSLNSICLDANIIINICKPKTHRIAGYTGALKNLVGISARKEYLPHHRKGEIAKKGDEYPVNDRIKRISSFIDDLKNIAYKNKWNLFSNQLKSLNNFVMKNHKDQIRYGMWYGNDTIWRTILDLNRIANYSDKAGNMKNTVQRNIVHIGDMIVCGEKEGPLSPSYKKVGGLLFADNAVEFDLFLVRLMGFDFLKIPTLKNAVSDRLLYNKKKDIYCCSNVSRYSGYLSDTIEDFGFIPASGWKGYL